jgi:uridine kinase
MDNKIIIHISGASGSGKTTLGNKLKDKLGNKVIIKDLDELIDEFITNFYGNKSFTYIDENEYQNYIYDYINKQKKPIIFVGLNDNNNPKVERFIKSKVKKYYDLRSQYNYYIDIDDSIITKQKCIRLLDARINDKMAMNDLVNNNEKFVKMFVEEIKKDCSFKKTIKMNSKWNKDYKKKGYIFMPSENIYKSVVKLLQSKNKVKTKKNKSTNIKTRKNKK